LASRNRFAGRGCKPVYAVLANTDRKTGLITMETSMARTILKSYPRHLKKLKFEKHSLGFNALKRLKKHQR
jgi:hypothetical protein